MLFRSRDKKGSDNVVADHLSRLVHNEDLLPLKDFFPDEQLLVMDDFSIYGDSSDACLSNLTLVLKRCMYSNLVLN